MNYSKYPWITSFHAITLVTAIFGLSYKETCIKLNPIFDWTRSDAVAFTTANNVPVNALHAQGFLSIGCAPCTRAVAEGEPERAGRWWWEDEAKKECGLHVGPDGSLSRAGAPA